MENYFLGDSILYLAKKMKVDSEKRLNYLNIGLGQLQVLLLFYRKQSMPINKQLIATELDIDKANAGRSVNKLIEKGYLSFHKSETIRNSIILTKSGLDIKNDIFLAFREVYDKMTQGISDDELNDLSSTLIKMKRNINL